MLWTVLNRAKFLLMNSLIRLKMVQRDYLPGLLRTCLSLSFSYFIIHGTYVDFSLQEFMSLNK
jgi:hypothetical protein